MAPMVAGRRSYGKCRFVPVSSSAAARMKRQRSNNRVRRLFSFLVVGAAVMLHGAAYGYWNLVWCDEFSGAALDTNHWTFDVGNGYLSDGQWIPGWGNNELRITPAGRRTSTSPMGCSISQPERKFTADFPTPPGGSSRSGCSRRSMAALSFERSCRKGRATGPRFGCYRITRYFRGDNMGTGRPRAKLT